MLDLFELDQNDIALFEGMEEHFQKYVGDNETNKLKNSLKKKTYDITNVQQFVGTQEFQVFFDYGEGFSEENSYKVYFPKNRIYNLNIKVPAEAEWIRIDPGNAVCEVQIISCTEKNSDITSLVRYSTNGLHLDKNRIIFSHKDPQIIIEQTDNNYEEINLLLSVNELSSDFVTQVVENINETIELRGQVTNLQNKCIELQVSKDIMQENNVLLNENIQKLRMDNVELISEINLLKQELHRINNSWIGKVFFSK